MPLPRYKDIVSLIKKGSTVEAQEMIMALREGAIELQEENLNLKSKITELESILKTKQNTIWEDPFYWIAKDEGKDGPFCQKCFDSEEKTNKATPFKITRLLALQTM